MEIEMKMEGKTIIIQKIIRSHVHDFYIIIFILMGKGVFTQDLNRERDRRRT